MIRSPVEIATGGSSVKGTLSIPLHPRGIVIFAHGSGSSRFSPRNIYVADVLSHAGFATLLSDLLTEDEDTVVENRFNIPMLTQRLADITIWIQRYDKTKGLSIGYFGASTGAAVALDASVTIGRDIRAIVSRGGRADLAENLRSVIAPTLLIVGGDDSHVLFLNHLAREQLRCMKELLVVPGATHLFEEEGALEQVALAAKDWFLRYL